MAKQATNMLLKHLYNTIQSKTKTKKKRTMHILSYEFYGMQIS